MPELQLLPPTDPQLNQISNEVLVSNIISPSFQAIIDRMFEMSASKGHTEEDSRQMVGLAAPQIGASVSLITIDLAADGSNKKQQLQEIINPKLIAASKETVLGREGCWSCGNICGIVERSKEVTIEGFDRHAKPLTLHLTNFTARIAQHEVDHLHGIRFPDRIPHDHPERLHWVKPAEFEAYRQNWKEWPIKCPQERWEEMKSHT